MKKLIILALLLLPVTCFAEDTIKIQVLTKDFVPEIGHNYQDAQYFEAPMLTPLAIWKAQNQATIDAEKNARIGRWIEAVKNPPVQKEPSKEDMLAEIASLNEQAVTLEARKTELNNKVIALEAKPIEEPLEEPKEPIEEVKP